MARKDDRGGEVSSASWQPEETVIHTKCRCAACAVAAIASPANSVLRSIAESLLECLSHNLATLL